MKQSDFENFAKSNCNVSPTSLTQYQKHITSSLTPYIIEERPLNVAQMDVFSRLMMDRIIFLGTGIDTITANIIQAQLLFLESTDSDKPIDLYINSPGGLVYDGLAIYDTMQYIKPQVNTICVGLAASMASVLLAAGATGNRCALPHSRVMIHQPMGGAQGQVTDMEIELAEIKKLKTELYDVLSKHTGQTVEQITMDGERDKWFTAEEAKVYGLIDNVLTPTKK
jgi:ATP-dependent Clp protease protease subunit